MANGYKQLPNSTLFALSDFDDASEDSEKQKWLLKEIKKSQVQKLL